MRRTGPDWRWLVAALLLHAGGAAAERFVLSAGGDDLVGEVRWVEARDDETLLDIARAQGVGQDAIRLANPDVDRWLPYEGQIVVVPGQHILPDAPRRGLVLNLPELRLYHYPADAVDGRPVVDTYPASIGRMDWKTPLGETRVVARQQNPSWHPPESVRREAAAEGREMPEVVPPGPDNPLGSHALRLGLPGYLIHGTNKPFGVGMRVTHGCVRLLPDDIAALYAQVPVGEPVFIVNQPVKTGWRDGVLYIEVHPPLDEDPVARQDLLRYALERVYAELDAQPAVLDGAALRLAVEQARGIPAAISKAGVPGRPISNPLFR